MANDSLFSINLNDTEKMLSVYQQLAELTSELVALSTQNSELAATVFKQGSLNKHIVEDLSLYDVKLADYSATANTLQLFVADALQTYIDTDKLIAKSIMDYLMTSSDVDPSVKQAISDDPDLYSEKLYDHVKKENAGNNNG